MARRAKRSRNTGGSSAKIWILVALAIMTGAWIFASRESKKSGGDGSPEKPQTVGQIKNADAKALIYTALPSGLKEQVKEYEGFTVNFNADNHTANYVGWELLASEVGGTVSRTDNFWHDSSVEGCPDIPDYKKSGFDRGHLYPAADAKWSAKSMEDCFSFANMPPQIHGLNSGAWNTLEDKERLWAQRDGRLIIVAGPIYTSADTRRIGQTGVRVPSGFFKVFLAPDVDNPRAIAFVYPNDYSPGNMQNYSMTVDEAEKLTGFDFFQALPDDVENAVESNVSFKEWDRRN